MKQLKGCRQSESKNDLPIHASNGPAIFSEIDSLQKQVEFQPETNIEFGIQQFGAWYKGFYNISSDDEDE